MLKSTVLLLFISIIAHGSSLKILGIFPHEGKSHYDVFEPLLKTLAQKGHEVTVVSHFPQKNPIPRFKDISIRQESIYLNVINIDRIPNSRFKFVTGTAQLHFFAEKTCALLRTEPLKQLAMSNETYDVAIVEFFNSDCFLGFVHKFKVPFIGLSSHTIMPWTSLRYVVKNVCTNWRHGKDFDRKSAFSKLLVIVSYIFLGLQIFKKKRNYETDRASKI